jgi:biopolymer transport protein ExbB
MNFLAPLAQLQHASQGQLTQALLGVTLGSAEWVLWLLVILSVASIAVMMERAYFYSRHRLANSDDILMSLAKGDLDTALAAVKDRSGMEAAVVREAVNAKGKGPDSVEELIAATVARERPAYERYLGFLGTLGSNAPFIGLFGTVLGIIKAFNDLGTTGAKGQQVQQAVMAGISEALVATAVGLAVAIPAVVAFNVYTRNLKGITSRTTALGHAVVGHLRAQGSR